MTKWHVSDGAPITGSLVHNNVYCSNITDEIVNATTTDNNSRYEQASRFFTLEEYEVADANLKGVYGS